MHRFVLLPILALACTGEPETQPTPEPPPEPVEQEKPHHADLFAPLPENMNQAEAPSDALVSLGRMLYYETRISKNHDIACNSCHKLDGYGVDNEPTSPGHKGVRGGRNSPTTYNAAAHVAQFWDGREPDVEAQAKGPVLNPVEMAMKDGDQVMAVLKSIPGYEKAFAEAFPGEEDPMTYDNFGKAVGAFERGLVTKNSRFDQYLGGKLDALDADEVAGLDLFVSTGCVTCHSGALVGGGMFQKLGAVNPWETQDMGRMAVTNNEADKLMFKVPSLRNIEKTGPYLHDGSVTELGEMVRLMAHHQLGKDLPEADISKIVGFLGTLTGELPTEYIAKPELPESGPKTPKPDPS